MPRRRPAAGPATAAATAPPGAAGRLAAYRAKRDFARTPEPAGALGKRRGRKATGLAYAVQKHAARRLHFDLRLELAGTLKSWAVPQGPSLDPRERRLAVHVEDHPLEYGGFEGAIPKGQYGGGTVLLWDRGTWEPAAGGDPAAAYAAGKLKFRLRGERLRGGWTLVRMGGGRGGGGGRSTADAKDLWLLIKERDGHAREGSGPSEGGDEDRSVLSGRTMAEIAAAPERVWRSDRAAVGRAPAEARRKAAAAAPAASSPPPPAFVPPQLATPADRMPDGPGWLFELKHDGYRAQLRVHDGGATVRTRNGHDWTARFGALVEVARALPARAAVLDGEAVVLDPGGVASFALLKEALREGADGRVLFYAFDLLHLDGEDLRRLPLLERKRRLEALLGRLPPGTRLRSCGHLLGAEADAAAVQRHACRLGAEGIVAKRADAPYRAGRGADWLKVKCRPRQEFVIGGYTPLNGRTFGLGALLLGVHDEGGGLRYVGRVGTGWDARAAEALVRRLEGLRAGASPFASAVPASAKRGARWARPELVAGVAFQSWTADGLLRHASFLGLREDKDPGSVAREDPRPAAPALARRAGAAGAPATGGVLTLHGVRVSSAERVVLDRPLLTKGDLARYHAEMAGLVLPHVAGRPLSLVRCPGRLDGACFFQRHPAPGMPPAVRAVRGAGRGGKEPFLAVDDAEGLLALVQFGAVELHPGGARADRPDRPDRLVFDLDPGEGVPWPRVVEAARELKERLDALGLESFPRTSGGKGLHPVGPLAPRRHGWPEAKAFAGGLARAMQADGLGRWSWSGTGPWAG